MKQLSKSAGTVLFIDHIRESLLFREHILQDVDVFDFSADQQYSKSGLDIWPN